MSELDGGQAEPNSLDGVLERGTDQAVADIARFHWVVKHIPDGTVSH